MAGSRADPGNVTLVDDAGEISDECSRMQVYDPV